jgi:hypothetical protein
MAEKRKNYRFSVGNIARREPLGRLRHILDSNV